MFTKKIVLGVVMVVSFLSFAFAEELTHGVLFKSSAEPVNNRTSLSLFDESLQKFEDTFSINFDLSIWDIKQFGYILRVIDSENQEIDFVFVNFRGEDNLYLDLHSPITHSSVPIPINKNDLYERRWLPLKISFDLKADKASIDFKDTTYVCEPIGLRNPSRLKFVYGLYGLNLDVPQMVIRNIKITKNGKLTYTFPLNESRGEGIHDINKKRMGTIKNPEWIVNRHHFWQKRIDLNTSSSVGITYNPDKNRILIFDNDSILAYLPQYENVEKSNINHFQSVKGSKEAIYNSKENKAFIYSSHSLTTIDMKDYSVESESPAMNNELFHYNVFLKEDGKTPYIFGGLKKYTYSNKIFYYNSLNNNWEELTFSGDSIRPRFFAAVGNGITPSQVLVLGGFGNESGKLEHGGKHLYDLFSVDLNKKVITKLWEINTVSSGFVPCNNLILDRGKKYIYTLCYPHHQENTTLQLYRFNLSDGSYRIVSDSIPLVDGKMNSSVYLFFSELMQEYYAVIKEYVDDHNSEIHIYSLLSTPVSEEFLNVYANETSYRMVYLLVIFLFLIVIGWWFRYYKKKNNKKLESDKGIHPKEPIPEIPVKKENAIYVFGDFTAYDKHGMDISYRFSSKIKSLFALIFFYSKEESGISTEKMTMLLWPDKDSANAKNTRGVTINRLRNILADIEGILLIHRNSKWFFTFDNTFYCDFIEYEKEITLLHHQTEYQDDRMYRFLQILKRGALFTGLQESWCDSFKQKYENNTEKILREYIMQLYENKKYMQLIRSSELYFMIDPLNEEVMNLCLKAFRKIGKTDQALVLYNKTDRPQRAGFQAGSVVGGFFIKMMEDKLVNKVK